MATNAFAYECNTAIHKTACGIFINMYVCTALKYKTVKF